MTKRVAILISGSGSNMMTLCNSMVGDHPARPVLVLSNNPDAAGLQKAADLGVEVDAVDHRAFKGDRLAFEKKLLERLQRAKPDILCLAGFMRILDPSFVRHWHGRMLNIHPSLLPKYKGLNTHARAIEAGDIESGCTVHEVTAELDGGPILGQARVPILPSDSPDDLAQRVLPLEHRLYPEVLRRYAAGDRSRITLA